MSPRIDIASSRIMERPMSSAQRPVASVFRLSNAHLPLQTVVTLSLSHRVSRVVSRTNLCVDERDGMVLSEEVGHGPFPPRSTAGKVERGGALLSGHVLRVLSRCRRKIPVSCCYLGLGLHSIGFKGF